MKTPRPKSVQSNGLRVKKNGLTIETEMNHAGEKKVRQILKMCFVDYQRLLYFKAIKYNRNCPFCFCFLFV